MTETHTRMRPKMEGFSAAAPLNRRPAPPNLPEAIAQAKSMNTPDYTAELSSINSKILAPGETLPVVQLRDGASVQTGTVATMLLNVSRYNAGERGQIEQELEIAVPTLVAIGLFDLFTPEEWIAGGNPGRAFVGKLAKKYLSEHPSAA